MSTLKTTNISHPNSAANDIVLDANGSVNVDSGTFYVDATNNRVGIGTSDPSTVGQTNYRNLVISGSGYSGLTINSGTGSAGAVVFNDTNGGFQGGVAYSHSDDSLQFAVNGLERFRCDSSGRLLVGTTSAIAALEPSIQIARPSGAFFALGRNDTSITDDETLGAIYFYGYQGSSWSSSAWIAAMADGAWGTNDYPSKLVFSTTADGAASPTERMRITSGGDLFIGKTSTGIGTVGIETGIGAAWLTRDGQTAVRINRLTSDGELVSFLQAGVAEGNISVSGTTVSYNGAHLSRWSQLPSGVERTDILRGSVLSNIDEMCEWGDEENEQLNRMKVSDVEGDKNVSGVFQAWDDDDDTYTNDFYCAMTGDFIIRIAQGVTVERGDLLMSAGDGTAKPQDDDIIRSKTIAKVTSTNVSCTYDDGSYCVPCVLMAC